MLKIVQKNKDLQVACGLQAARSCTRAKHARSWSVMPAGALQDKKYRLAVQLPHNSAKPRVQAASQLCFEKLDSSYSILTLV